MIGSAGKSGQAQAGTKTAAAATGFRWFKVFRRLHRHTTRALRTFDPDLGLDSDSDGDGPSSSDDDDRSQHRTERALGPNYRTSRRPQAGGFGTDKGSSITRTSVLRSTDEHDTSSETTVSEKKGLEQDATENRSPGKLPRRRKRAHKLERRYSSWLRIFSWAITIMFPLGFIGRCVSSAEWAALIAFCSLGNHDSATRWNRGWLYQRRANLASNQVRHHRLAYYLCCHCRTISQGFGNL